MADREHALIEAPGRQDMQKLLETGKVRNIGVSNFQITHLEKLLNDPSCTVVPAVNQIEVCRSLFSSDIPLLTSQLHPYNPS